MSEFLVSECILTSLDHVDQGTPTFPKLNLFCMTIAWGIDD